MFQRLLPLAEALPKRGLVYRLATGGGLLLLATMLAAATVLLSYAHYFAVDPKVTPIELYHNTWRVAKDNIYDQSKLKNWDQWEHKYDAQIKTEEDALRYANEMVAALNESYTGLLTVDVVERDKERADGHYVGIGVEIEFVRGELAFKKVLDGGPADKAGLKAGDRVVAVDGHDVKGWEISRLSDALKGKEGEPVTLSVTRQGQPLNLVVNRGLIQSPTVKTSEASVTTAPAPQPEAHAQSTRVGYLRIDSFTQWSTSEQVENAMKQLSGYDALVIDLRDNPGGFVHEAIRTASLFMDSGVITRIEIRVPEKGYLNTNVHVSPYGLWLENSYGFAKNVPLPLFYRRPNLLQGRPVVLLVNENTASAAEMFSAALIDNGIATAVGTTTYGKGIGQTYIPVGNGHRLRITHLKATTPNGVFLGDAGQSISNGIKPNVVLQKRGWGAYGTSSDNQYNEAVRILEEKLSNP